MHSALGLPLNSNVLLKHLEDSYRRTLSAQEHRWLLEMSSHKVVWQLWGHSPEQSKGVSGRHQQERMEQSDGEKTEGLCEHIAFGNLNRWSRRN